MKPDMIRSKMKQKIYYFRVPKNCETLIEQTDRKPQERLALKVTQPRETFSIQPFIIIGLDFKWMFGLTSLEVYNPIFSNTKGNKKFERYQDYNDRFPWNTIKHNESHWTITHIESDSFIWRCKR